MVEPVMEHLTEALKPVLGPMHRTGTARKTKRVSFWDTVLRPTLLGTGASATIGAISGLGALAAENGLAGGLVVAATAVSEATIGGALLLGVPGCFLLGIGYGGYYWYKKCKSSPNQPAPQQQSEAEQTYRSLLTVLQSKAQQQQPQQEALEKRIQAHMEDKFKPADFDVLKKAIAQTKEGTQLQVDCAVDPDGSSQVSVDLKHCLQGLYSVPHILKADKVLSDVKVVLVVGPENAGKTSLISSLIAHAGGAVDAVEAPGNKVHTADFKAYRYRLPHPTDKGAHVLLVDCPGSDSAESRNGDQSTWQCLERVPDLCFVLLPFTGDTADLARSLPDQVAHRVCQKLVLVVNKVDGVLNQTKKGPVWETYNQVAMSELRAEFARDAGLSNEDVHMTVLADDYLFQEVKDNLRDRGVLLKQDAILKFIQAL